MSQALVEGLEQEHPTTTSSRLTANVEGVSMQPREVSAFKRLLREVFADLVGIKQQLVDLTPREEEADVVIPHAGALVRPAPKRFAAGLRYKARSQLSGSLDTGFVLPWSNTRGADEREHVRAALSRAGVTAGGPPQLTALLQSAWGDDKQQTLTARLTSTQRALCSGTGLRLDQLMLRQELRPGLKVMVAAMGGSLANLSRRLNPSADYGCTRIMRHGHDLPMVLDGGSGAAALFSSSALSLSVGQFMSGASPAVGHHSVAQLSVHSTRRSTASLVASHTRLRGVHNSRQQPYCQQATNAPGAGWEPVGINFSEDGRLRFAGILAPACSIGSEPSSSRAEEHAPTLLTTAPPCPGISHFGLGLTGSATVLDAAVLSAWYTLGGTLGSGSSSTQGAAHDSLAAPWPSNRTGFRVSSVPDTAGRVFAAALSLSSSPSPFSASAAEAGSSPHSHGLHRQEDHRGRDLVAEVSASIPLQDGLSICPGVVLTKEKDETSVGLVMQSTWRF